jgi:hypothetical protein
MVNVSTWDNPAEMYSRIDKHNQLDILTFDNMYKKHRFFYFEYRVPRKWQIHMTVLRISSLFFCNFFEAYNFIII